MVVGVTDAEPMLRVVRGTPTDEELAAVTVMLLARAPAPAAAPAAGPSLWVRAARPGTTGRLPAYRGHDAWRASGLPR
jgi:hypothetical protein